MKNTVYDIKKFINHISGPSTHNAATTKCGTTSLAFSMTCAVAVYCGRKNDGVGGGETKMVTVTVFGFSSLTHLLVTSLGFEMNQSDDSDAAVS